MQTFIKKIELFLKDRAGWQISFLIFLLVIMCMISIAVGRFNISPFEIIRILASKFLPIEKTWDPTLETVIFNVRLPRIIAAILVGASLSTAGAAYQGMFKNPLVSPDILGASAGAGFGLLG